MPAARSLAKAALFSLALVFASCLVFTAWVGLSILSVHALFNTNSPRLAAVYTKGVRVLLWPGRLLNSHGQFGGPGATCVLFSTGWGLLLVVLTWLGFRFLRQRKKTMD